MPNVLFEIWMVEKRIKRTYWRVWIVENPWSVVHDITPMRRLGSTLLAARSGSNRFYSSEKFRSTQARIRVCECVAMWRVAIIRWYMTLGRIYSPWTWSIRVSSIPRSLPAVVSWMQIESTEKISLRSTVFPAYCRIWRRRLFYTGSSFCVTERDNGHCEPFKDMKALDRFFLTIRLWERAWASFIQYAEPAIPTFDYGIIIAFHFPASAVHPYYRKIDGSDQAEFYMILFENHYSNPPNYTDSDYANSRKNRGGSFNLRGHIPFLLQCSYAHIHAFSYTHTFSYMYRLVTKYFIQIFFFNYSCFGIFWIFVWASKLRLRGPDFRAIRGITVLIN